MGRHTDSNHLHVAATKVSLEGGALVNDADLLIIVATAGIWLRSDANVLLLDVGLGHGDKM